MSLNDSDRSARCTPVEGSPVTKIRNDIEIQNNYRGSVRMCIVSPALPSAVLPSPAVSGVTRAPEAVNHEVDATSIVQIVPLSCPALANFFFSPPCSRRAILRRTGRSTLRSRLQPPRPPETMSSPRRAGAREDLLECVAEPTTHLYNTAPSTEGQPIQGQPRTTLSPPTIRRNTTAIPQ